MLAGVATAGLNLYRARRFKAKKLQTKRKHSAKYFQYSKNTPFYTSTSDMFRCTWLYLKSIYILYPL